MSTLFRFYTEDLMARVSVADTTEAVNEMIGIHASYPVARMALGRLLTGAYLLAAQLKEGFSLGIRVQGDGPLGELFAESTWDGKGRAYCQNPYADVVDRKGHLDLSKAVGNGILVVSRMAAFMKQPHISMVPLMSGEIAEDLTTYIHQSNQVPAVVALATPLDNQGNIRVAGGVLVELLPDAPEEIIRGVEAHVRKAPPLSQSLLSVLSPEEIARQFVHDSKVVAREEPLKLTYQCKCSEDRVDRTLVLLGCATLSEMISRGEKVPVRCEFCGRLYQITIEKLRQLLSEMKH